jgi:hypothetical protein
LHRHTTAADIMPHRHTMAVVITTAVRTKAARTTGGTKLLLLKENGNEEDFYAHVFILPERLSCY